MSGGVPILAASAIVDAAASAVQARQTPMAIFWDLDRLPIPAGFALARVVEQVRSLLLAHGREVPIRCYSDRPYCGPPTPQLISECMASGCILVHCPQGYARTPI